MECTHCNLTFKTKYTLKSHVLNSKTCLKKEDLLLKQNLRVTHARCLLQVILI